MAPGSAIDVCVPQGVRGPYEEDFLLGAFWGGRHNADGNPLQKGHCSPTSAKSLRLSQELRKLDRFGVLILDSIGYVQQNREKMGASGGAAKVWTPDVAWLPPRLDV